MNPVRGGGLRGRGRRPPALAIQGDMHLQLQLDRRPRPGGRPRGGGAGCGRRDQEFPEETVHLHVHVARYLHVTLEHRRGICGLGCGLGLAEGRGTAAGEGRAQFIRLLDRHIGGGLPPRHHVHAGGGLPPRHHVEHLRHNPGGRRAP